MLATNSLGDKTNKQMNNINTELDRVKFLLSLTHIAVLRATHGSEFTV